MKIIKIFGHEYLIIEGKTKTIFSDNECVHEIFNNENLANENLEVPTITKIKRDGKTFVQFGYKSINALKLVKAKGKTEINLTEWIRYFGIKTRIHENFELLKNSIKECEIDLTLPLWQ